MPSLKFWCIQVTLNELIRLDRVALNHRNIEGETRIGLVGQYAHPFSLNIIAGISRNGKTELYIFSGSMEHNGFQLLLMILN